MCRRIIIMTEVVVAVEHQMVAEAIYIYIVYIISAIVGNVAVEAVRMTVKAVATNVTREMEAIIVEISMEVINLHGKNIRRNPVNSIPTLLTNTSGKGASSTRTTSTTGTTITPQ